MLCLSPKTCSLMKRVPDMLRLSYHLAFQLSFKFTALPSPFSTQGTSTSPWRPREDHFPLPQAFHTHPLASQKFRLLLESHSTTMTYISQHLSLCPVITVSLLIHRLCVHSSTNNWSKILENKNAREVQKAKLGFVIRWQLFTYSHIRHYK